MKQWWNLSMKLQKLIGINYNRIRRWKNGSKKSFDEKISKEAVLQRKLELEECRKKLGIVSLHEKIFSILDWLKTNNAPKEIMLNYTVNMEQVDHNYLLIINNPFLTLEEFNAKAIKDE